MLCTKSPFDIQYSDIHMLIIFIHIYAYFTVGIALSNSVIFLYEISTSQMPVPFIFGVCLHDCTRVRSE